MYARDYAEAIYLAAKDKDEATQERVAARAKEVLVNRGHGRLLPSVVCELEKITKQRASEQGLILRVARKEDLAEHKDKIVRDARSLGSDTSTPPTLVIDETAIGGYEVRANGIRIDRTHKRVLRELYATLITH